MTEPMRVPARLTGVLRQIGVSVIVLVAMTIVLGLAYPTVVWAISRIDRNSAEGAQLRDSTGCVFGSSLLGIDPRVKPGQPDPYLHARVLGSGDDPMAPGDPAASAASNRGPSDPELAAWIDTRRAVIAHRENVSPGKVPVDAVTGSGSGLDPDISVAYAQLQAPRIARVTGRGLTDVRAIIAAHTHGRQWGFLGQQGVNVSEVNRALGAGCNRAP